MLVFCRQGSLPTEEEVVVAPSEDALHGVGGGVPRGGGTLLEAAAAQIVIVAD